MTAVPTDPADPLWGSPPLPPWVTGFRSHQIDAVEEIMHHYAVGADVVLLDAPTGSGKTLIADMARRLLNVSTAAYIANTNSLLDQFQRDFPYAHPLKGKANYPTLDSPELFMLSGEAQLTCADCAITMEEPPACGNCPQEEVRGDYWSGEDIEARPKMHCPNCHPVFKNTFGEVSGCPYRVARWTAGNRRLVVTNTSYFIADTQLSINSVLNGRQFVVADECDTLEGILMGQIEVNISKRTARELGINPPEKKTVAESWIDWLNSEALPKLKTAIDEHRSHKSKSKEWIRKETRLDRLQGKLRGLVQELNNENAVYDGYNDGDIIFRPIKVDTHAPELLWSRSEKWLCMSATLFPDEFTDSTGLNNTDLSVAVVRVPSTFPVERRPIYYRGFASNTYKNRDTAWPAMADGLKKVLDSRPDSSTLVHSVSYGFTKFLVDELKWGNDWAGMDDRPIFTHENSRGREEALEKFKANPGGVLITPAMDRGVDLPGAHCDLIVILKMPFMSTADKQVKERMYSRGGQVWYATQTLKSLVQMTGRGMRSEDDLCECFILDEQFVSNVWRNSRRWLPDWWVESVDFSGGGV